MFGIFLKSKSFVLDVWEIIYSFSEYLRTTYGNTGQVFPSYFVALAAADTVTPPQEIEPATTDCRAETLQLSHQFISDAKSTSHGNRRIFWSW